ncbi:MAG: DEAD/DEAH box helicase [Clostridia bacterium]|nr:DEAD/DEAH box helicase [Clostridia bacterium]
MDFSQLNLLPEILSAIRDSGYEQPSPIQSRAIPVILEGKSVLGCAQTGSGKTAAFSLPILDMIARKKDGHSDNRREILALILAPTRELALQIDECIRMYSKYLTLKSGVVFGGTSQKNQEKMLSDGIDILVATPGRLWDLYRQKLLKLNKVEIFVIDEADRMLDMGFIADVRRISDVLVSKRQTLMFSATMPDEIVELIGSMLSDYVTVEADPASSEVKTIDQRVYFVDTANKHRLLVDIIKSERISSALVFTRTKHGADALTRRLTKAGIKCRAIHGDKSQPARQVALSKFKKGEIDILIATEIAARGIDIENLPYVFNYNIPEDPEMYIHRIGRTGRAGASGSAISFCNYEEQPLLYDIEKLLGHKIPVIEGHGYPMTDFTADSRSGGQNKTVSLPQTSGSFAPPTVSKFPKGLTRPRRPRSFKKMK